MIICFHHNDPDGYCAAAIVRLRHEESWRTHHLTFVAVDYRDVERLDFSLIKEQDQAIIVDFSFPPLVMKKLLEQTEHVIWIDHHATAEAYGYVVEGLRNFTGKKSGCELTWEYYRPTTAMPEAVRLIGDYDTFRLEEKARSIPFFEGLKSYGLAHPGDKLWYLLLLDEHRDQIVQNMIKDGFACIRYRRAYGTQIIENFGYITYIDGIEAMAVNIFGFGSLLFEDVKDLPSIMICYIFDGKNYTVSLYSKTVDVSAIAVKYGGGGHRSAAGFVRPELPFKRVRGINEA